MATIASAAYFPDRLASCHRLAALTDPFQASPSGNPESLTATVSPGTAANLRAFCTSRWVSNASTASEPQNDHSKDGELPSNAPVPDAARNKARAANRLSVLTAL